MRKHFLIASFGFICATTLLVFFSCHRKSQDSPNIILIILDAARADHFSCYGYEKNTTPRIDVISRKGVLFLNNFSPATYTLESLPRIFSSRYFSLPVFQDDGWLWGVRRETPRTVFKKFDDQQIFLTDILSLNGYLTVLFHDNGGLAKGAHLAQKFDESYSFLGRRGKPNPDEKIISALTPWIERNKAKKFFIYCHIMSPHIPYRHGKDSEFLISENPSGIEEIKKRMYNRKDDSANGWGQDDLRILRGLYDSNLKHTDKWVGVLYDRLKELGLENKTLVIITSDHGENLGEHNRVHHGGPAWDTVTHVPLAMIYPPLIPSGVRATGLTESIDIMPTILDICGIDIPKNKSMDGISLLPTLPSPKKGRPASRGWGGKEAVFTNNSIRTVNYKYLVSEDLLYDLRKDPGETRNIAKQYPLVKQKFKKTFERYMGSYRDRFKNARREKPLDFPFYIPLRHFRLAPEDAFQECRDRRENAVVLKEAFPEKAWLLNRRGNASGLFCLPANGPPPPITLSVRLPKGKYRVSVLLESSGKISLPPEKLGFRFRFNPQKPFALPGRMNFVRKHRKVFYYYLDLGNTELTKEKFFVRISFRPPDKGQYVIRHIRFDPGGIRKEGAADVAGEEELRRRLENLKSLGYL